MRIIKTSDILAGAASRRTVLKSIGAGAATLAMPSILRAGTAETIRVGYVSPMTGPLAPFGEADAYTVEKIKALLAGGIENKGKKYNIDIIVQDAQSNPNKAAELAGNLILNDEVNLIVPASTTDVNNNVADQAELYGCPSISAGSPWQAFIMPRGGADKAFEWNYHFFWGLEDVLATYVGLWKSVETNKKVGMLFPQNADGETWGNRDYGLPPTVEKAGFQTVIPSMFQPRTNDFSAQIAEYKAQGCDIIGGIAYPSDLKTFITQCSQQNYKPKVVTVAAALLFPSGIESMGALGNGMSTEVWWTPAFPYKSSLTGQTSTDIAQIWEKDVGKEWIQPLGYAHAIWEVVVDILKRSADPRDRTANRDAAKSINLDTLVGKIQFTGKPHPNICKTPIFGGQWVKGAKYPYDLKIVDNALYPDVLKPEQKMELISWA
jgi:branched-chain amino acid transport system substrate-binding protein